MPSTRSEAKPARRPPRSRSFENSVDQRRTGDVLFIGIDEAGYGPNLGPLVVSATVWQQSGIGASHDAGQGQRTPPNEPVPDPTELWRRLTASVRQAKAPGRPDQHAPTRSAGEAGRRRSKGPSAPHPAGKSVPPVIVDDSKRVYSRARGLAVLERGVLSMLASCGRAPRTFSELRQLACIDTEEEFTAQPWFAGRDVPLPRACDTADLTQAA
ncbi:MAG: hypothetical protein ACOC46_04415, partial [Pirellulales bacterium]